jgi:hypothetical protein
MSQISQRPIQNQDMSESQDPVAHRPLCPACVQRMQLIRVVPRGTYVCEQMIFQCHRCDIALTQAGDGAVGEPAIALS